MVFAKNIGMKAKSVRGGIAMKAKQMSVFVLGVLIIAAAACYRPYGSRYYPHTPRFEPTHPAQVELLRREPRRDHIRLGEVWINPKPWMSRYEVEGILRERTADMGGDALVIVADRFFNEGVHYGYWHRPVRVYERQIVGIAVRYRS
jgi:hypothetical protein